MASEEEVFKVLDNTKYRSRKEEEFVLLNTVGQIPNGSSKYVMVEKIYHNIR